MSPPQMERSAPEPESRVVAGRPTSFAVGPSLLAVGSLKPAHGSVSRPDL